jgi:hypothetical protein
MRGRLHSVATGWILGIPDELFSRLVQLVGCYVPAARP